MKLTFYTTVLCAAIAALTFLEPAGAVRIAEDNTEIIDDHSLVQSQLEAVATTEAKASAEKDDDDDEKIKETKEKLNELIDKALEKKESVKDYKKLENVLDMVKSGIQKEKMDAMPVVVASNTCAPSCQQSAPSSQQSATPHMIVMPSCPQQVATPTPAETTILKDLVSSIQKDKVKDTSTEKVKETKTDTKILAQTETNEEKVSSPVSVQDVKSALDCEKQKSIATKPLIVENKKVVTALKKVTAQKKEIQEQQKASVQADLEYGRTKLKEQANKIDEAKFAVVKSQARSDPDAQTKLQFMESERLNDATQKYQEQLSTIQEQKAAISQSAQAAAADCAGK